MGNERTAPDEYAAESFRAYFTPWSWALPLLVSRSQYAWIPLGTLDVQFLCWSFCWQYPVRASKQATGED